MDTDTCTFGILDCKVTVASLIHVFSTLTGKYPKNLGQLTQHYLSPNEEIPQIFTIFKTFPSY